MGNPQIWDIYLHWQPPQSKWHLTSADFSCCKGLAHSSQVLFGNCLSSCHSGNLHPQPQFWINCSCNINVLILMETPGHHTKCTDSRAVSIHQPSPHSVQSILWMWDNHFSHKLLNKLPAKQWTPCQPTAPGSTVSSFLCTLKTAAVVCRKAYFLFATWVS